VTALEEIERVVAGSGDADDVVREVVRILHERLGRFVQLSFVEAGGVEPGPRAGEPTTTTAVPVVFQETHVADLEAGGGLSGDDRALLERVAELIAPHALVAWDTGGEAWEP
jgi:hypothetical protein